MFMATSDFGGPGALTYRKTNSGSSFTVLFGGYCMDSPASALRRTMMIVSVIALTAVAYFVSSGLQRLWWPVWFAPIPVLLLASRLRAWQAFAIALVARALAAVF